MSHPLHTDLRVRLQPRSSRAGLVGLRPDGVLVARVSAPPVDGKANAALCKLVARAVGIAPSRVSVLRGERARDKVLRLEGVDGETVRAALRAASAG